MSVNKSLIIEENNEKKQIRYDCCICFEELGKTNISTTPCGHTFCFNCIVKCLKVNNTCPYCRTVLKDDENVVSTTYNDDDDEESIWSEDQYTQETYIWENTSNPVSMLTSITELATILHGKGITMENILSVCFCRYDNNTNHRDTNKIYKQLINIVKINDNEKKNEWTERKMFMQEDLRRNCVKSSTSNILEKESEYLDFNMFDTMNSMT